MTMSALLSTGLHRSPGAHIHGLAVHHISREPDRPDLGVEHRLQLAKSPIPDLKGNEW